MRSSVSYCAEQAKKAAKTFGIATDCDTHESVGHLLIYLLSLQSPVEKLRDYFAHIFPQPAGTTGS